MTLNKTTSVERPLCYPLEKAIDIGDLPVNLSEHVSKSLALNSKDLDSIFCNIMSCRSILENLDSIREGYMTFRRDLDQEQRELQEASNDITDNVTTASGALQNSATYLTDNAEKIKQQLEDSMILSGTLCLSKVKAYSKRNSIFQAITNLRVYLDY